MRRASALFCEYCNETLETILELSELRVLDVSTEQGLSSFPTVHQICVPDVLKHLVNFDMSGNAFGFTMSDIRDFIQNHPNLEVIGLIGLGEPIKANDICELSRNYPNVMMIGDTGDPLVKALTSDNVCRSIKLRLLYTLQKKWLVMNNQDNSVIANVVLSLMQSCINDREIILAVDKVLKKFLFFLRGDASLQFADRIANPIFACMKHHRNNLCALRNCFFLLFEVISSVAISEKILCIKQIIRSLQGFNDNKLMEQGLNIIHLVTCKMSEDEKKTITADSEYLEWLLTVIVKHLPRSAVKTLLAFSSEHPLSYIPVANSNPNCIPDRSRRLGCLLEILDLLIERNSDACQTLAELGGIMIIAALIQVCPPA
ncbi:hypothetical protein Aperf_G00000006459 [Anoplocephala perfoliata]